VLRAGPLSDERVIRLANRRFVPFFFDLANDGAVGDRDARAFVVKARKELGGGGVPTPPILFMTADGEVLGEVDNYASADAVYAAMKKVLANHADHAKESDDEKKLAGLDRAELLLDLGDLDGAKALLEKESGAKAAYALGHVLRLLKEFDAADKAFEKVDDKELADDVRVEKAWRHWVSFDAEKLLAALKEVPAESNRWTEARYLEGLALYHSGEKENACDLWKATIAASKAQDRWLYRADWAYCGVKEKGGGSFSSDRKGASCLGRIGYMGNRNPDLKKR
jgi:hypothetical protein